MEGRLQLHDKLVNIVGRAYFQPPESIQISYPCAVYKISSATTFHADNNPYFFMTGYEIEIIHEDPDEDWIRPILNNFKYVSFERRFVMDNLYHEVFRLFF